MACFTVSAVAAIGVGVARHIVKHNEKKAELAGKEVDLNKFGAELKWSKKLGILETALFAGSFLLAGEHVIHGEVTPFPPFLTAMDSAEGTAEMLYEMGTVGVAMLGMVVAFWAIGIFVYDLVKFRKRKGKKVAEVK